MINLLYYPTSTCSQKVLFCLHEKRLCFEERVIDLKKQEHVTEEYLAINPNGVVPTLLHNGRPVLDSSVIMEYLEEIFPDPPLGASTAMGRAELRAWLRFFEEVPTTAVRIPSFAKMLLRPINNMSATERRENSDKRTIRRSFYRSIENGIDDSRYAEALERLKMTVERMEAALVKSQWLTGDQFTIGDICVIPTFDRLEDLGHQDIWASYPFVSAWWQRAKSRPAFTATYVTGTRLSERYQPV
jgi:glutathione S-transferase